VVFDIPLFNIVGVNDGDPVKKKQFVLQSGLLSSALEHAVPEQLFVNAQNPGEAISAVKALQKASGAGQRIYHITPANQLTILPNIHHHPDTMDEIRNALNAGKEVITHTDAVSVPGWSGAGYIITDPITGDGAYKIAGGGTGSFLDWWSENGTYIGLVLAITSLVTVAATFYIIVAPIIIAILTVLAVFVSLMNMMVISLQVVEGRCPDLLRVFGVDIEAVALILSFFGGIFGVAFSTWLSFIIGGTISGVTAKGCRKS
jgi:hypothetical protein